VEVAAFMEVAAQRRDMLCLGQCERAVVHPVCIRTSGDHAYPTDSYPTHAVGYARKLIDQHCIDVSAAESRSVLDLAG
jgi:hypothetical protein